MASDVIEYTSSSRNAEKIGLHDCWVTSAALDGDRLTFYLPGGITHTEI